MSRASTLELIAKLRSLKVKLTADGDRLRYTGPAGVVTAELRGELAAHKTDLLEILKEASLATRRQPPPIAPVPRDGALPLSFAQMRLWLLDQLEPGAATYNVPSRFRLKGKLNLAALEQSLTEIVRRHEALRTCFPTVERRPVQKIASPEAFHVSVVDLQGLPEAAREEEARLASIDARQPFDLGRAPLMRATLLRLAPEEHVLLLNMHHIVFDAWSFGVFGRELSALYKAFAQGEASPLQGLPIQYADFAVWQREWLQGEALESQWNYWKEKLSGSLLVLELPTDRARPSVQTYNGATVSFAISKRLTDGLKSLSHREGATLFVTLLAAFNVLLLRYTGQEDVLVGTPIANRNRAEIEGLIGLFLNTLVMRSDLSGNPSFRELLGRVKETALGAYAHQDFPFEKLVEDLNPQRDLSRSPIFQVMFSLVHAPVQPLELAGLESERIKVGSSTSKFDLSLYAIEMPAGLSCAFEYNTDLFNADRIERMVGHLQVLLEAVVAHPEQRLSGLSLLPESEMHRLLVEWNQTWADFPRGQRIHDLFEEQVEQRAETVAVAGPSLTQASASQVSWTYAELNQRANELAHYLQAQGVGPEGLVAVCMERTAEMVVALLAVLKAGGAYVPLDPAYPPERLAFILEETQAPVVLTQQSVAALLPSCQARMVCLDDPKLQVEIQERAGEDFRIPRNPGDPSPLAYVLYTSGSTGKPKGVEICHRAVVNFLNSMRVAPGMEGQDTLLSVTTLTFDIFGLEIWLPLTTGAKVVIAPEAVAKDGKELTALMRGSGATVMQATPSTWRLLLESGWEGDAHLKILCGGEAWPAQLAEQLLPKCASLWNMYGPTETTIWSAVNRVEKGKAVLIGHPIANTQFYVVDANVQPVPVGVPGELMIGGEGLARGYWNRPDLTAEKFIANPFSGDVESRLYHTGDLVRYVADDTLEFLGRIDQQVKLRGFRIELGEIESVLRTYSGVREAAVVVREEGEKQLVAYLVAAEESAATSAEWRDYLKQKLPEYMIPAVWVVLPSLPLTPNGKIDRKALSGASYTPSERHSVQKMVLPQTLLEMRLRQLWLKILGARNVSVRDSFFDVGGHSILAVRMVDEVNKLLGVNLAVPTFFLNPTIEGIARTLEQEANTKPVPKLIPLRPARCEGTIFFLEASLGMCRLAELLDEGPALFAAMVPTTSAVFDAATKNRDALTEVYAELIGSQRPSGPCVLIGHSFAGIIAFQVAHQLERLGRQVDMIVLLDTLAPISLLQRLKKLTYARAQWAVNWRIEHLMTAIAERAPALFSGSSQNPNTTASPSEIERLYRPLANFPWDIHPQAYSNVAKSYRRRQLKGRGVLVRAKDAHRYDHFEDMGWGGLFAGGLEIIDAPGDHVSLLVEDTHILDLSQALQECLARLIKY